MGKYHLRKKEREITDQIQLHEILRKGKYVTISMCRDNEPYLVTLSYGYDQERNALYFHCSLEGLKIDFIRKNPHVCATVIEDRGYVMNDCRHVYRSVVFWGKMYLVKDLEEKKQGIEVLINHLEENPELVKKKSIPNEQRYLDTGVLRLDIEELTGKQGD